MIGWQVKTDKGLFQNLEVALHTYSVAANISRNIRIIDDPACSRTDGVEKCAERWKFTEELFCNDLFLQIRVNISAQMIFPFRFIYGKNLR